MPRPHCSWTNSLRTGRVAARILFVTAVVLGMHGCLSMEHQACGGETTPCEARLFAGNCSYGDGCTWGTQCAPVDCASVGLSECQTFPHCYSSGGNCSVDQVSETGLPNCTATVTKNCLPPCAGVSQKDCGSVPGCTWRTACTGHVIGQCTELKDEDTCNSVLGCAWTTQGGLG